ncbi:MAG: hypothetical protein K2Y32_03685 [Candidatus Obscuribacterales bacterium]|nr:hypothetical protein [Candidatus Obscuribacterales bacterium]
MTDKVAEKAPDKVEEIPLNLSLPADFDKQSLSNQSWALMDKNGTKEKFKDAGITFNNEEGKLKFDLENKHDTWLQLGALSYHQNREANYRETNYGIGILRRLDDQSAFAVGYYRNSLDKDSFYAAYHYTPYELGPVKLGMQVGAISGYKALKGLPTPMLLPLATIEGKHIAADITCIPPIGTVSAVCAAQLRVKF